MKRILAFLLVAVLCLGALTSCSLDSLGSLGDKIGSIVGGALGGGDDTDTLETAKSYVYSKHSKDSTAPNKDYDLVAKVAVDGVTYNVVWTVNLSGISIKESAKAGFWTVDLPEKNDAAKDYVLTATISDAQGNSTQLTFNRTLPVYGGSDVVDPPAGDCSHVWNAGEITTAPTCKDAGVKTFTCTVADCGETKTEPVEKTNDHTPGAAATCKDAQTCTVCGTELAAKTNDHSFGDNQPTCSVCGTANPNYQAPNPPAGDCSHVWNAGEITTAPTCKDAGVMTFTCTVAGCGETKTEPVAKTNDHSFGDNQPTCSVCGTANPNYQAPNPDCTHAWDAGTVTKAATCKEAGVMTYTCSKCQGKKTEAIDKLTTHTPGAAATCKDAQTCTVCGIELAAKTNDHSFGDNQPTCSVCGTANPDYQAPQTPPAGNFPANLVFTGLENKSDGAVYMAEHYPTWTINGKIGAGYLDYLGFGRANTNAGITADKNSSIMSPALSGAAFKITAVIKGNGGNSDTTSTLTFTLVDANGTVVATGYQTGSAVAAVTPPESEDGTFEISFTFVQGKTWADAKNLVVSFAKAVGNIGLKSLDFVADTSAPACEHNYTSEVTTAATCETAGVKTFTCSKCNDSYTEAVSALGHDWANATCTAAKTCKRTECGVTEGAPLPHSFTNYISDNNATCTADGTKTATCDNCTATDTETDTGTALNHTEPNSEGKCDRCGANLVCVHSWGDGEVTTDPTCITIGVKTYTCSKCGDTKTESVPTVDHTWNAGEITTAPTCKDAGVKTYTCTIANCGATKTEAVEKNNNHTPGVAATCKDAQTCTVCGTELAAKTNDHNFGDNLENCTVCGAANPDYQAPVNPPVSGTETTVNVTIKDYAAQNGWANGVQYSSFNLNNDISISASTDGNNGKYYTSESNWRLYQSNNGTFTITAADGKVIKTVKITYTVSSYGVLLNGEATVKSNATVTVNSNSITFSVGNTGTATNGQARISAIEVVYTSGSSAPCTHNFGDNQPTCSLCGAANPDYQAPVNPPVSGTETTVNVTIADYAAQNGWANGVQYSSFNLNNDISISASTDGNNGKYYDNGSNWRLYQADNGTFTITAADGKVIKTVKITYTVSNNGVLLNGEATVESNATVTVNSDSITFSVGNTGTATNGQARVTAIEVVYQ